MGLQGFSETDHLVNITFYYVLPFGSRDHLFVLFDFMKCCMTNEHNCEESSPSDWYYVVKHRTQYGGTSR